MTIQTQIQQPLRDNNKIHMLNNVTSTHLVFNKQYNTCDKAEGNLTHNKGEKQSMKTNPGK